MKSLGLCCLLVLLIDTSTATQIAEPSVNKTEHKREKRVIPVFQVVTFQNTVCTGSSSTRNGTCYTAEECSSRGGVQSGSCAQGYGVCCIATLDCGATSSENLTYFAKQSTVNVASPCSYTICPADTNICRIKLDFMAFDIAGPQVGTLQAAATVTTIGGGIGDCISDTFTVANPGGSGAPLICGFNSGQHMIFDVSPTSCITLTFNLVSGSSTAKEWDIAATQYACGDAHDLVGAPGSGCLQYLTGTSGTFESFNWPSGTHTSAATHLSSQDYTICIRQEPGYCGICYCAAITSPFDSTTFGISLSNAAISAADTTACTSDFLVIPDAGTAAHTATAPGVSSAFCGRFLAAEATDSASTGAALAVSVCSFTKPFTVGVKFDANEVVSDAAADMAMKNEDQDLPTGFLGFQLNYVQQMC